MSRAQSLAEAVLDALKAGNFIDAFSEAGKSMEKSEDIAQQYIKAYEAYMKDPYNEGLKEKLDELVAAQAATEDYHTLKGLW